MIRFCSFLVFLLLVVTSVMLFVTRNRISDVSQMVESQGEGKALIGGSFTLTNQDGVVVSDKDYRGKLMLVFFGFTSCPDICPVTAATYAKVLALLGDKAKDIAPLFITVDPETDTPAVLKQFLGNIDPRIIGLTGTQAQTEQIASEYKAFFSKTVNSDGEDTIDHSGFIYLMDKNGAYVQHFPYDATAQDIVAAITNLLK